MVNKRGRGTPRTCPYCGETFRNLPPHLRACDDIPPTEDVIQS
jgi:hypothetical protein